MATIYTIEYENGQGFTQGVEYVTCDSLEELAVAVVAGESEHTERLVRFYLDNDVEWDYDDYTSVDGIVIAVDGDGSDEACNSAQRAINSFRSPA